MVNEKPSLNNEEMSIILEEIEEDVIFAKALVKDESITNSESHVSCP